MQVSHPHFVHTLSASLQLEFLSLVITTLLFLISHFWTYISVSISPFKFFLDSPSLCSNSARNCPSRIAAVPHLFGTGISFVESNFSIYWVRGPIISGCFKHIIFTEFTEQEAVLRLCLCSWAGFYLVAEWGLVSSCGAQAAHCSGVSCCGAQAPALEHRLNSCGALA